MNIFEKAHYQVYEEKKVVQILSNLTGKRVLDYGCGKGKYLAAMREKGIDCIGIDINSSQVDELKKSGFEVYTDTEFLPDVKFDCILLSHIIEHLDGKSLMQLFNRLFPLLNDNATLIIITPVAGEHFYYDFTHIRPYYPQSIRMLFGGINTSQAYKTNFTAELEELFFFRDCFRFRLTRAFYPSTDCPLWQKKILNGINTVLAHLYVFSKSRFGRTASWLGIYKVKK